MSSRRKHWDEVYRTRDPEQVSWYQENPQQSAQLIASADLAPDAAIIDVGGGASRLVDRLLDIGFTDVTVLDLSAAALAFAGKRLAARAGDVTWIEADVINHPFERGFDLWHDRAVFHFLCEESERRAYVDQLRAAVSPGGHVIIATFGLDGPEQCSGLPIERYGPELLSHALGEGFVAVAFEEEAHRTPTDGTQHFLYGHFRRRYTAD